MVATPLPIVTLPTSYAKAGGLPAFTAADVANGNSFVCTGREILVMLNTSGVASTVTVTAQPDAQNRNASGDNFTVAVPAFATPLDGFAVSQMFPVWGWASGGLVQITVSSAVQLMVLRVP